MPASCITKGADAPSRPSSYKTIGIILAVASGILIGTSFVLKKTGLLKANKKYNEEAGEGYGYLKNAWWWTGMTLMIIGEICNFVAYSFTDAILVTPLGALSVVITTILSAIFLKERLSFVGKVGCFNCIIGSIVIVLNAPQQSSVATIQEMQCFVIAPGFLSYTGVLIIGAAVIAFWAGPRYGKKSMLVYLSVCSLIGGLSVVATQGLGAAILSQINGTDSTQFKHWFLYVLLVFVVCTLLTEIVFLNKALNLFNTALVTPTYYVYFTSATIVTSAILFRGFHGTPSQITTIVLGFLIICSGVVLLQLSKSAKDVPDTAVFTGDLDQVRTVAQQEEHDSEPKADAIRGAAALIRSISKARQHREHDAARRLHTDSMEPIGENELVEWDGLRRRRTVLAPGQSAADLQNRRSKTLHAPHVPSRLSSTHSSNADGADDADSDDNTDLRGHNSAGPGLGLFPTLRSKARAISNRKQRAQIPSYASDAPSYYSTHGADGAEAGDMNMAAMSATRKSSGRSAYSALDGEGDEEADLGGDLAQARLRGENANANLPPYSSLAGLDTAYKSPNTGVHFAQRPTTADSFASPPPPTPPPHRSSNDNTRRTFSFQNVFGRGGGGSSSRDGAGPSAGAGETLTADPPSPNRPISSRSSGGNSFFARSRRRGRAGSGVGGAGMGLKDVTEEERLGLVKGDEAANKITAKVGAGKKVGGPAAGAGGQRHARDDLYDDDDDDDEDDEDKLDESTSSDEDFAGIKPGSGRYEDDRRRGGGGGGQGSGPGRGGGIGVGGRACV